MSSEHIFAPAPSPLRSGALFDTLICERKVLTPGEKEVIADAGAIVFVDRTWVTLWLDPSHAIRSK